MIRFTWRDLQPIRQYERAAELVAELYQGAPIPGKIIAERLGLNPRDGNWSRSLSLAASRGLPVKSLGRAGWVPVCLTDSQDEG